MVKVTVRLVGGLTRYLPPNSNNGSTELEISSNSTVSCLIEKFGMPADRQYMVSVNDEFIPSGQLEAVSFNAGDRIMMMPALKGG